MTLTRRQTLLSAASALAAPAFLTACKTTAQSDKPASGGSASSDSRRKYGGYPMGIQSFSLRNFDTDQCLAKTQELGLHYIEFFGKHYPITNDPAAIAAMRAKLAAHDIKLNAYGVQAFTKDHEKNREFFVFAKASGFKNISADFQPDAHDSLNKLVKEFDIRVAGHNHGPGHHWSKVTDIQKQIEGLDPRIGACADLGHYIRSGEDPAHVIHALKGRLYGIHLKDFKEPKKDSSGCVLGEGVMNVEAVFRALNEVKFPKDGYVSLEYEEKPEDPMADLKKCLEVAAAAAQKAAKA